MPRGFLTQCDSGGRVACWGGVAPCPETTRLPKPGQWRCDDCAKKYGPLKDAKGSGW